MSDKTLSDQDGPLPSSSAPFGHRDVELAQLRDLVNQLELRVLQNEFAFDQVNQLELRVLQNEFALRRVIKHIWNDAP